MEEKKVKDYWVLAFEYPTLESAFGPWTQARDIILELEGTGHTSVYRSLVEGKPAVVIIGESPLSDHLKEKFREICNEGKETAVVQEVVDLLMRRRRYFRISGQNFRQGHYRL